MRSVRRKEMPRPSPRSSRLSSSLMRFMSCRPLSRDGTRRRRPPSRRRARVENFPSGDACLREIAAPAVTDRPRRSSYAPDVTAVPVEQWIKAGDMRRAASWLVTSYGPDVLATCVAMVSDRAAAEDVTQEVFSDAFRALSSFRGDSSPRTWLLSIARNRCIDYLRARKRDPWAGPGGGAPPGGDDDGDVDHGRDPDAYADRTAASADWFADRALLLSALDALAEGD